jgi:1-deoxy-D-xylulose-5-phosphate reductoisomerase
MKKIAILGSTGSIGTQALDVIEKDSQLQVVSLSTHTNILLLKEQIQKFKPQLVCVMNEEKALLLKKQLKEEGNMDTEVVTGLEGLIEVACVEEATIVLTAVVGMIGLRPTIEAIKRGKTIALANKETLVTAGEIVMQAAKDNNVSILPVDSEHCAIFECLQGNRIAEVEKLILTASGGPFRDYTKEQLEKVKLKDALKHPNWNMGKKITIDSATLMNKGLEVIEASHLFGVLPSQIDVVVHRESIVHSMVSYQDGSTLAQLGMPDMRHPIAYALHYPDRKELSYIKRLDLTTIGSLTFEKPKMDLFPLLGYAIDALKQGGSMPAVLNAANEVAVEAFIKEKISFAQIQQIIHEAMEKHICINKPSLDQILEIDLEIRAFSRKRVEK